MMDGFGSAAIIANASLPATAYTVTITRPVEVAGKATVIAVFFHELTCKVCEVFEPANCAVTLQPLHWLPKPVPVRVIDPPALTTRGMKEPEMRQISAWINRALELRNDDAALERIRGEVAEMANQFPLYAWRRAPAAVVV